jgi:flagellar assembly protein FliH
MSHSARRLSSGVATDRFAWQASGDGTRAVPLRPVPLAFAAARGEAFAMSESRDVQAREMPLPSVSAEHINALEQKAFDEGYAKGQEAAAADTARQVETTTRQLTATIQEIAALRMGVMRRAERELIHLALAMAQRIVRREVNIDPDLLLVIARVAIDRLGDRAAAVVHLNPADHAVLSKSTLDAASALELVADTEVPRGGCRIQSAFGEVDAGIEAQIREVSRELLGGDDEPGESKSDGVFTNT